jgi:hypothetical protein
VPWCFLLENSGVTEPQGLSSIWKLAQNQSNRNFFTPKRFALLQKDSALLQNESVLPQINLHCSKTNSLCSEKILFALNSFCFAPKRFALLCSAAIRSAPKKQHLARWRISFQESVGLSAGFL